MEHHYLSIDSIFELDTNTFCSDIDDLCPSSICTYSRVHDYSSQKKFNWNTQVSIEMIRVIVMNKLHLH